MIITPTIVVALIRIVIIIIACSYVRNQHLAPGTVLSILHILTHIIFIATL